MEEEPIVETNLSTTETVEKIDTPKDTRSPPVVARNKKQWPNICQLLQNNGIKSDKNLNTRDGIQMFLPTMDKYDQLLSFFHQNHLPYHTYGKANNREIGAVFKGVAEDLLPTEIAKELGAKGFHPRVVARFNYKDGKPMPIILVIVPSHETGIKDIKCKLPSSISEEERD
ncbi:hypothetical protein JTB14_006005 [Gonioctena quinquepunctata]|nr:hypothetical protein JTB14_006005 [Gonioctena quinquepunctata]